MNINLKTILVFLLLIPSICCANSKTKEIQYQQDEYVTYAIPDGVEISNIEGELLTGRNYSKEGQYNLNVFEVPVGITLSSSPLFAQAIGSYWVTDTEPTEEIIDGYPVKVYSNVMKGNYDLYITTYEFSNGEKSVILTEAYRGQPGKWWRGNLKWNMPQKSTLSLQERSKQLAHFLTILAYDKTGGEVEIKASDKTVDIILNVAADSNYTIPENEVTKAEEWKLLNSFDVFSEYASKGYNFNIILVDPQGKELAKLCLP